MTVSSMTIDLPAKVFLEDTYVQYMKQLCLSVPSVNIQLLCCKSLLIK